MAGHRLAAGTQSELSIQRQPAADYYRKTAVPDRHASGANSLQSAKLVHGPVRQKSLLYAVEFRNSASAWQRYGGQRELCGIEQQTSRRWHVLQCCADARTWGPAGAIVIPLSHTQLV